MSASSHAEEKAKKMEAVVLMPLRATKDIPQDEMTQYEAALVKSLSRRYVVYSGQRVLEKVREIYAKRSSEARAGTECDETKCVQDIAIAFQTELVAIANIRKTTGGYSISLTINDVAEDKSVFSEQKSCKKCDEFGVAELLGSIAGGETKIESPKDAGSERNNAVVKPGPVTTDAKPTAPTMEAKKINPPVQVKPAPSPGISVPDGMAYVKGGCFDMGDVFGGGISYENPVHKVCLDDFFIDKFLVTQSAYQNLTGRNPAFFKGCPDCPVEQTTWDEARDFCVKAGKRLPTEAEWEYAARDGGKIEKYAGTSDDSLVGDYAWFRDNAGRKTHPVGQLKPNGLGLYDMGGNVWEWVADWYEWDYYKRSPENSPKGGGNGQTKVIRGGSWLNDANSLRTSARLSSNPGPRSQPYGFRCARQK